MKHILHILRKDIRGLWYELSVAVMLTVGMALLEFSHYTRMAVTLRTMSPFLAVLAWILLIVQLVQADSLVGTEHDWRTRPIRRRDLVLAKVLFVALFIGVPMVVADVIVLVGNGFSPLDYLPGMLWKLLWLITVILAPAAALGTITRTLPQALLAALAVAFVLLFGFALSTSGGSTGSGAGWVRGGWMGLAGLTVAIGVLWLQYVPHRTMGARVLAVGGTIVVILTGAMLPWSLVFGVQKLFATQTVGGVKVVPQPGAELGPEKIPRLRIAMTDLPEGYKAEAIWGQLTIDVDGVQVVRDAYPVEDWLMVEASGHRDSPARIHGKVWLAVLARQMSQEFEGAKPEVRVPRLGACRAGFGERPGARPSATISCQHPYRVPAVNWVIVKTDSGAERREQLMPRRSGFSPFPSELLLLPMVDLRVGVLELDYGTTATGSRVVFETWAPVAYVERQFTMDVKRLGDYVAGDGRR